MTDFFFWPHSLGKFTDTKWWPRIKLASRMCLISLISSLCQPPTHFGHHGQKGPTLQRPKFRRNKTDVPVQRRSLQRHLLPPGQLVCWPQVRQAFHFYMFSWIGGDWLRTLNQPLDECYSSSIELKFAYLASYRWRRVLALTNNSFILLITLKNSCRRFFLAST